MKAYIYQALSLDVVKDKDIIDRLISLKKWRRSSAFIRQAIREKIQREEEKDEQG